MISREEFEAWVITHHIGSSLEGDIWDDFEYPELVGQFIYDEYDVQNSWASWQASRQALLVELLPNQITDGKYPAYEDGWNDMRHQAEKAIEAAGVRVKE